MARPGIARRGMARPGIARRTISPSRALRFQTFDVGLYAPKVFAELIDLRVDNADLFFQVHAAVISTKRRDSTGCARAEFAQAGCEVVTKCIRGAQSRR
jgi:hypothetical protein